MFNVINHFILTVRHWFAWFSVGAQNKKVVIVQFVMHGQIEGSIDLTYFEHHVLGPSKFCIIL
jgi:lipid-A-disaccharide synthase-like uncharacterized protein